MAVFKCKMCGGALNIKDGVSVAICGYCGTTQTLPTGRDEVITNLFNRANNLRLKGEFDKAEQVYERILEIDNTEAEAHWGIVLCRYGVEYVEDPATYKRIPTCHRTSFEAVVACAEYMAAVECADHIQRRVYESEARAIDEIQRGILGIVKNEDPFDVFICYKETDQNGKRTRDSVIANDIYHQLTADGLKVFYAAITLEDKLGKEYEPYIFAALNSAKVMLVVGTKPEYFEAVWVKNEWGRFMKLMKSDRSKLLIPCYRDLDAYELPEEFAHLQAQDMGKIGFINDIIRGIKKVVSSDIGSAQVISSDPVQEAGVNVDALLKRAFIFVEDGQFDRVEEMCEQVLNVDPENASAYLAMLLAECRVSGKEMLAQSIRPFDKSFNFKMLMRFGDEALRSELQGYLETIKVSGYPTVMDNGNVMFGSYYVNSNTEKERLEWEVLWRDGDSALVISKSALAFMRYHDVSVDLTWQQSSLRAWLNEIFINEAFTDTQKKFIEERIIENPDNNVTGTLGGYRTTDRIFVLSVQEAVELIPSYSGRRAFATPAADLAKYKGQGGRVPRSWWLRTPGLMNSGAAIVDEAGVVDFVGTVCDADCIAVRPAMYITL